MLFFSCALVRVLITIRKGKQKVIQYVRIAIVCTVFDININCVNVQCMYILWFSSHKLIHSEKVIILNPFSVIALAKHN
jgi:hypothetical protein